MPIVEETPPFMRALTSASMDTPGPYEKVAKEAFFNVTLPDPAWPAKEIDEYLQGFNRGTIISTAVHEAFPGHYVQFLWVPSAPTKVRKLMGCGSNAEGWAHYTEQMMLDEGYGKGDLKLRLGQLQDALLRDARYVVGIRMHTGDMTMEQAIDFFVTKATRSAHRREGSQARHLRPDLPRLHAGQTRNHEVTRRLQSHERREIYVAGLPRRIPPTGHAPGQTGPQSPVRK
jgi:hypothetical protein